MSKKLVKGRDYDGWALVFPGQSVSDAAWSFRTSRNAVLAGRSEKVKRKVCRNGGRLVRVKLVEVTP